MGTVPAVGVAAAEDTGGADTFDAEFEAAREAETPEAEVAAEGAADGDAAAATEAAKAPLDPATTAKRLADTQAALKASRAATRAANERAAAAEAAKVAAAPAAAVEDMPDPKVDPIGALEYVQKIIEANKAKTAEQTAAQADAAKHQAAFNTLATAMSEHEDDFRALHDDYDAAADHFAKSRKEDLAETGLKGKELDAAVRDDIVKVVARALQAGKDPAEIVYNLAKRRGFGLDGSVAKLQTIARGQEAAKSLGTGGTGSGGSALTYGAVSNLKGAAFDAAFDKLRAQERRA